jgi:hypothetical protein
MQLNKEQKGLPVQQKAHKSLFLTWKISAIEWMKINRLQQHFREKQMYLRAFDGKNKIAGIEMKVR